MARVSMKTGPQLYLKCQWCGQFFEYNGGKRKRWHSDSCKQAAWRAANDPAESSLKSVGAAMSVAVARGDVIVHGGGPINNTAIIRNVGRMSS